MEKKQGEEPYMNDAGMDTNRFSILVVDDNINNLKLLEGMLLGAGYGVHPALSGRMALMTCEIDPPDLVLLDINMPGMNGYEVCRKIKANQALKDIPVIFISALTDKAEKLEAFESGGVDYITKPFQFKEVLARVNTHLTMRKMQKSLKKINLGLEERVKERTEELTLKTKELEKEIRRRKESEEQYTNIFNATNEIIVIYDAVTKQIIDTNHTALEQTGYSREEMLGQKAGELRSGIPSYFDEAFLRHFEAAVKGELQVFEWKARTRNRKPFWVEISLKNSLLGGRGIVILLARNISERKKAEREKRALETQVRESQKMEAIGTLAGGISHDFNNILSAIIGYSDLALELVSEDDEIHYHVNQVLQAGYRAKDLVKQILLFSRQRKTEKKPVKIGILVKEVSELLKASIPSYIEIHTKINVTKDTIMADPGQIHQILMNLCTNAAHAIGEKEGSIHITLSKAEIQSGVTGNLDQLEPGEYLCLIVKDTGQGIPEKIQEKIFDPFFTTKEREEGTGLGLSVVHGIVKGHKGTITLDSEMGKGTTFCVYLPRYKLLADTPDDRISRHIPKGKASILFVDDEAALARLGTMILEPLGYEVTTRTSSVEALELFESDPGAFDLAILDQTMPKMTGIELARKMNRIRDDMLIILCSGFSQDITQEQYQKIGIKEYLSKPLGRKNMAIAVNRVLEGDNKN